MQQSAGLAHSTQVKTHTGIIPPIFYSAEQPNALAEEQKAESGANLILPCAPGRLGKFGCAMPCASCCVLCVGSVDRLLSLAGRGRSQPPAHPEPVLWILHSVMVGSLLTQGQEKFWLFFFPCHLCLPLSLLALE